MGAKLCAKTHEPKIAVGGVGRGFAKCFFERKEHGRAAHVTVVAEDAGAGGKRLWGDDRRDGVEHIATAGMSNDPGNGTRSAVRPEAPDGVCGERADGAVEEIAELAVALLEAEFVAVGGDQECIKLERAQGGRAGRSAPNRGRGVVAEEARADDDAGIVVEAKRGGADFHRDARDRGAGLGGEEVAGRAEDAYLGATAEANEILAEGLGAQSQNSGDVARDAGAEVARAWADDECAELGGQMLGLASVVESAEAASSGPLCGRRRGAGWR